MEIREERNKMNNISDKSLFGDDFNIEQINEWYEAEKEGYAELGAKYKTNYNYAYHAINTELGFKYLNEINIFNSVLGLGSAYGDEFLPIINKIKEIFIVEPSEAFCHNGTLNKIPCHYVKPNPTGIIPFDDNNFDLITCFGVLHHMPNVSFVMKELYRVLKPNAVILIREPIVSMGDWRLPRRGLTKNERGIPLKIFREIIKKNNFSIEKETIWNFSILPHIFKKVVNHLYNNKYMTKLDILLSKLFTWNYRYHAVGTIKKIRPTSIFYILKKQGDTR